MCGGDRGPPAAGDKGCRLAAGPGEPPRAAAPALDAAKQAAGQRRDLLLQHFSSGSYGQAAIFSDALKVSLKLALEREKKKKKKKS